MSRLKGTLIDAQAYNRGRDGQSPQIDLSLGGQYGYQPDFAAYPSNTGYTPRNLIPILVEAPRGFQNLPNPQKWVAVLKSLMENQSKNITGLRTGITVEASERPVGGAGPHAVRPNQRHGRDVSTYTRVGRALRTSDPQLLASVHPEPNCRANHQATCDHDSG